MNKEIEIPEGYEARIEGNKVIFELKDDEKIMKAIGYAICVAAHEDGTLINDVTEDEALAYLEKQKEQKLTKWSEEDKVMLNNIIRSVHMKSIMPLDEMDDRSKYKKYENFLNSLPERFNLQPKQELSKEDERLLNIIIDILDREEHNGHLTHDDLKACVKLLKSFRSQSKQEWSERDKDMLNSIIATCQLAAQDSDSGPARHLLELQERFLNSLPERFNLQPKQEWSNEDEKMLNGIIERGNSEIPKGECGLTPNQVAWLETRLKSLRPQPHWKPSVEQMADLDFSARLIGATCHNLKSLYYDLKEQYSL